MSDRGYYSEDEDVEAKRRQSDPMIMIMMVLALLVLLPCGVQAFREINSSTDPLIGTHAVFEPYAAGYVGYYGDPANPSAERLNEGAPYSPDTPRIFFSAPLQQTCPGMVGPGRNGDYYCYSREYGYCDRRSGLCVCNQGYTGLDCTACLPGYFKQGGLCSAKKSCPNDCSRGGECDYATGVCSCNPTRRGADGSQRFCAFDEKCVSCTSSVCLRCVEGFSVDPTTQTCVSCARYDPRCLSCDSSRCLTCADLQLNSVRRSGARRIDQPLPDDERVREFSQTFVYGSQDPRVFDEAESFTIVPASYTLSPLNESSFACTQGGNGDAGWSCSAYSESHRVCGHRGVFSFVSPLYAIDEAAGDITITVQRSGGGLGRATLLYDLEHVTTTAGDVSPSMFYTSSQKLEFAPGVVTLTFKLQIHDDHVLESNKTLRLHLREPFEPSDLFGVAPATLGNQRRTLVTILDDDAFRPVANLSRVVSSETTLMLGGAAGDQLNFQIQSVLGNGVPGVNPSNEAVFLMTSYIEEDDSSSAAAVFRTLRLGTVVSSGAVDVSLFTCTWIRERAVSWNSDLDVFRLVARPQRSGDYSMSVKINSYALSASPFIVTVLPAQLNPARSVLSGSGLLVGRVAGQAVNVVLVTRDLYANRIYVGGVADLKLQASRSSSTVPTVVTAQIVDNADGTYKFTYTPRVVGSYSVAVMWKGAYLHNSPYTITVVPSTPVGSTSSAQGPGIIAAQTNVQTTFEVTTRDSSGNAVPTGGVAAALSVALEHPEKGNVSGNPCTDLLNGHYTCTYTPHFVGGTRLHVALSQQAILGSPFLVDVTAGPALGSRCVASGDALVSAVAGQRTNFTISIYDAFGNAKDNAGSENISVTFTGPGVLSSAVNAAVGVTYIGGGTFVVAYTLSLKGTYKIGVTVDGVAVVSSPFTMYTYPALASSTTTSLDLLSPTLPKSQIDPPVVFIAGSPIVARLTTRDVLGNVLETGGNRFQLGDAVRAFLDVPIADEKNGSYLVTLRPTRSVLFPFTPKLMVPGGLNGSYFAASDVPVGTATADSTPDHSLMVLKRIDPFINFNFGERPPLLTQSAETFSVRWDGFLLPRYSEIYTFEVDVLGFASLRVGNSSAFVQPGATNTFLKVPLIAQNFVEFELNFSKPTKIPNATVYLSVDGGTSFSHKTTTLRVFPNVATAVTSFVSPNGAGVVATGAGLGPQIYTKQNYTYHVTVRDAFGNVRDSGGDLLVVRVHGPDSSAGNITDLTNGDYIVTYRAMLPGAYEIETRVAEPERGLTGYYYVDSRSVQRNLPSAVRTVDAVIDFDWSKNVSMRGYPRVVWRGFLHPLFTEEYTLWVKIQSDVGSAADVYIDGQTVIDGLNAGATSGHVVLVSGRLHAITVEYRSASLQHDPGYLSLFWQSVRQTAQLIPTQALISDASEILPRTQLAAVN
ncbi:hypothetical protein PF002_g5445 [Phytophthora fragariae]|uniref:PA14 domain-containing protein n=1 Tax=Phytophthora fragariae TaxID=53985 RepID=A0A6A4A2P4_9STRA|nr:hypothetical protein PF002_g5445 [Phytophthora fragariae]